MEKQTNWHRIDYKTKGQKVPSERWGHKMVNINGNIVVFGGFANRTYLNDLWSFNTVTEKWTEIQTTGSRPEGVSNFTMHFDERTNQLIVFGGGCSNKKRFNTLSFLNWSTKVWTQYDPPSEQNSPWERTYHSSEFRYPYLITFGGEGVANLDFGDLWAFNIEKMEWKEVLIKNGKQLMPGRRFPSTALVNDTFYVIGGCKLDYKCFSDIKSVDLSSLFSQQQQQEDIMEHKTQQNQQLLWKQHKLTKAQEQLICRWGHTTQVYNNRIYIFGGRNVVDYNDLLEFNPKSGILKEVPLKLKKQNKPECRRKQSSCMLGASMVIFGGYNSQFMNDIYHISLFGQRKSLQEYKKEINQEIGLIQLEPEYFESYLKENRKFNKTSHNLELKVFEEEKIGLSKRDSQGCSCLTLTSVESRIKSNSAYFNSLLKCLKVNPEKQSIKVRLPQSVNLGTFEIFHMYLIKELLILPENMGLNGVHEILVCADYFLTHELIGICEKFLILRVIKNRAQISEISNLAATWDMRLLLDICAEVRILDKSFTDPVASNKFLTKKAEKLKAQVSKKYISEIYLETQLDIKKNKKYFKKNPKASSSFTVGQQGMRSKENLNVKGESKKSFMDRMIFEPISRLYSSNAESQEKTKRVSSSENYIEFQI